MTFAVSLAQSEWSNRILAYGIPIGVILLAGAYQEFMTEATLVSREELHRISLAQQAAK